MDFLNFWSVIRLGLLLGWVGAWEGLSWEGLVVGKVFVGKVYCKKKSAWGLSWVGLSLGWNCCLGGFVMG